jgi:hypothetical protein
MGDTVRVPAAAILDRWSDKEWDNGVQIDKMEELTCLAVQTTYSIYEITILDGKRGEILVKGGKYFPERTPVHLAGATFGGSFCKMRGIYTGMMMEFNHNGRRTVTSPVRTIGVVV